MLLKFSPANSKLKKLEEKINKKVYSFSTLSGHNCPFADKCLSKAVPDINGIPKIQDGPNTEYRCFSASNEVTFPAVYKARKYNTDLVRAKKTIKELFELINSSIPKDAEVIRIHVAGDFYSQTYFDAWLKVCELNPTIDFYAYTKSIPFLISRLGNIPNNLNLTVSRGGKRDDLIDKHKLIEARVVFSEDEAKKLGFKIDKDDFLAYNSKDRKSFALLLHGVMPKNSEAAKAISLMKKNGIKFSYNKKD